MSGKPKPRLTEEELQQLEESGFTVTMFGKKLDLAELFRERRRLVNRNRALSTAMSRMRRRMARA